ncbi:hypothetical protein DPMN_138708 [Dreissena polymorpha]|uniref:Uncharacterized protein n=2 Tax=Dreissena polymorpha TaxID=45954 RepID=A0A9D4JIU2_DREPO|nr:hypothetical protein DPMN_138708 [Dreissena polymorpha]
MLPTDHHEMTASNKRRWFEKKVSPVVDKIVGTSSAPPAPDMNVMIQHKGTLYHVAISAENAGKTIQLKLNGDIIQINVPAQKENVQEEMEDDVQKYSTSIVRVAIDFMVFCEVIKAGDINMISILMKRFIPLFIGLSS